MKKTFFVAVVMMFAVIFVLAGGTHAETNGMFIAVWNASVSIEGNICLPELTDIGNDRYKITYVIKPKCTSSRSAQYGRTSKGVLTIKIKTTNGKIAYLVEMLDQRPEVQIRQTIVSVENARTARENAISACRTRISSYNRKIQECERRWHSKRMVAQRVFDQYSNKDDHEYDAAEETANCTCGVEEYADECDDNPNYQPPDRLNIGECVIEGVKDVFRF